MNGEELKKRRLALGLSQDKLAKALGVTTSSLARWEQGALNIGNPEMLQLALRRLEDSQHYELQKKLLTSFPRWDQQEKRVAVFSFTYDTKDRIETEGLADDFIQVLKRHLPGDAALYRPHEDPIRQMYGENGYHREAYYIRFACQEWKIAEPGSADEPVIWIDNWLN